MFVKKMTLMGLITAASVLAILASACNVVDVPEASTPPDAGQDVMRTVNINPSYPNFDPQLTVQSVQPGGVKTTSNNVNLKSINYDLYAEGNMFHGSPNGSSASIYVTFTGDTGYQLIKSVSSTPTGSNVRFTGTITAPSGKSITNIFLVVYTPSTLPSYTWSVPGQYIYQYTSSGTVVIWVPGQSGTVTATPVTAHAWVDY